MSTPHEIYTERSQQFARTRDEYARRSNRLSNLRLALFLGAIGLAALAIAHTPWWWLGVAALSVLFVVAVARHHDVERLRQRHADLVVLSEVGLARLRRDWAELPLHDAPDLIPPDSYANDLDLFGHASLMHLLATAITPVGAATLQRWLLEPAAPPVIAARQQAIGELSGLLDFRDEIALRGRAASAARSIFEQFLSWVEGDASFPPVWLTRLAIIMPIITVAALIASLAGLTGAWWLLLAVINLVIVGSVGGRAEPIIAQVASRQNAYRLYAELLRLASDQPLDSAELRRLQAELTAGRASAAEQMARLQRIMAFAEQRFSYFYIALQAFFLWGIHIAWALARWQRLVGPQARRWLAALGEIEALCALACLHHDQPEWAMPQIDPAGADRIQASDLGHPLLAPSVARTNAVGIGPAGTFLLITGSNMSGKSTLLRAIGLNAVLAQAGGPVFASALRLPPVTLATSVRINDSLEQGVSYFMAELLRLKWVVDVAEQTQPAGERITLFLLDEILHGTNTSERQIAARQIIRHLLGLGAIGAVSTHDLSLAQAADLAAHSQPFYFTEQFSRGEDGPIMEFDYQLRPGLAPSTNALKLMEIVGLPLNEAQAI